MQNIVEVKSHESIDSLCFYLPVSFRPGINSHYSVLVHISNHHCYTKFYAMIFSLDFIFIKDNYHLTNESIKTALILCEYRTFFSLF